MMGSIANDIGAVSAVNALLHLLANLKIGEFLFLDLDYLPGLWITSLVAGVTLHLETAKTPNFYAVVSSK